LIEQRIAVDLRCHFTIAPSQQRRQHAPKNAQRIRFDGEGSMATALELAGRN